MRSCNRCLATIISFIHSETIKNATECVRNSYNSWVILLFFPPGKQGERARAPAFVLGHLTSLTHPYSTSGYMEIRIRWGGVSYTAVSFLKYRILPPLCTAPCGSITPLNTLLYIAYPPTLNRWSIPKAFHFLSPYTRDRSIIKYMSVVTHLHW